MSVKELESAIQALSPDERWKLTRWMDDHRHELLPLDSVHEREILARLQESENDPSSLESFTSAEVKQLFQEFADVRGKTTPPRQS